jgi:hypothetical protein
VIEKQLNMFLLLSNIMIFEIYTFHNDYHLLIGYFFGSGGGSHIVYQLLVDEVQNSDSGSATSSIKAGSPA